MIMVVIVVVVMIVVVALRINLVQSVSRFKLRVVAGAAVDMLILDCVLALMIFLRLF